MKRICLVVQRFGAEIVGGSEQLARCYAQLLRPVFEVHVATSCAADHTTWRNVFEEGVSEEDGVHVHRFRADFERTEYWHRLHLLLVLRSVFLAGAAKSGFSPEMWPAFWHDPEIKASLTQAVNILPRAAQEEFIRLQGPYCSNLFRFIEDNQNIFDYFIFFTYLYPTTYFGLSRVPRAKRVLVPTLHDEPTAYLPILTQMLEDVSQLIFLSPGEQRFAQHICKLGFSGNVIGMPVSDQSSAGLNADINSVYVLYCGRIEGPKGSRTLFDYFLEYKRQHPSGLKLVLTGHAAEPIPQHRDITFLGYVDEGTKRGLMRGALAFVHPSPFESFSIVLLEAFAEGTPCIVNAQSIVLSEHCRVAGAGLEYRNYEEFAECLSTLIHNPTVREALGARGRDYAKTTYSTGVVATKLREMFGLSSRLSPEREVVE
jgi:glycosyltransferase involved in cell wall biosynthesis